MNAVIACGGTGGHLFPGIAVAEVLRERGHEVLLFVSEKEIDSLALSTRSQFRFEKLPTIGFPSVYSPKIFGFIRPVTDSLSRCRSIYQKFKPQIVLGMGGFTSTAPILAGPMRGISTLIHESNAVPGKANRLASKMVRAVLLGFKECAAFFPKVRTELTGTPIRTELMRLDRQSAREKLGLQAGVTTMLVMGGSQGASAASLAEIAAFELPSLLIPFPYAADDHQTRNAEIFARAGAAFVLKESELTPELLTQKIRDMIDRPEQLRRMSERCSHLAPRDAANRVAVTMEKYTQS